MTPLNVDEFEHLARERMDGASYDYYAGAAGDERTLADNRAAFDRVTLRPRVLVDVSAIDLRTTVVGQPIDFPVMLAPTAFNRLANPDGEMAAARAAGAAGTLMIASTLSTCSLEDIAGAATGPLWFQLYVERDRAHSQRVLARAAEHGYEAIVLTADLPVAGRRERELRHGEFAFPDGVALTSHLGSERERHQVPIGGYDTRLLWTDVAWVREASGLPVVVKGVLCAEDADAALDAGADAIVVSNHGGRQLDRQPVPLEVLPAVVDAVGERAEVYVDGGVLSGGDVVAAVAYGARAALVGRAYLYGLMAGGERGVQRAADILRAEVTGTLALMGVTRVSDLRRDHVRMRPC